MASTVGDPFLLASYPLPSRATQTKKTGTRQRASQLLHASHSRLPRSEDGQVTVAAQGDGVHVLDVRTYHLHRDGSFTFNTACSTSPSLLTYAGPIDDLCLRSCSLPYIQG